MKYWSSKLTGLRQGKHTAHFWIACMRTELYAYKCTYSAATMTLCKDENVRNTLNEFIPFNVGLGEMSIGSCACVMQNRIVIYTNGNHLYLIC